MLSNHSTRVGHTPANHFKKSILVIGCFFCSYSSAVLQHDKELKKTLAK